MAIIVQNHQILPPTPTAQRIDALDTLRGFALLGILLMNIQSFAMIEAAYFDPSQHMDLTGVNWAVWVIGHMFADLKFMAIFSMLFGAGIVLLTERREAAGLSSAALHYTRNFWLLIFGLLHATLIWYGDILVTYALCAFVVYWVRRFSVRWLLILGLLVLCIPPLLSILSGLSLQQAPEAIRAEVAAGFVPTEAEAAAEIAAYRGTWMSAFAHRLHTAKAFWSEALPFFLFWRASGLMLIGMALYKAGVLSAQRSAGFYGWMILAGFGLGLPLLTVSVVFNAAVGWDIWYSFFGLGSVYNYVGSLGLAAAYIGLVMRLVQVGAVPRLQARLAAVGRMALTNYIAQSILCTLVFYGFGLGYFGHMERWAQVLVVPAVWALQLWLSPLWLGYFRYGPLEWLWRVLTYVRWQPMRA